MDQIIAGMTVPQAVDPALWRAFQNSSGLLALLPVGIYICDQTGKVVWSNEKAATLWGRIPKVGPGGRARGSVKVFLPNGDRITAQSGPMARVLATGKGMNEQEAALEQPDGTRVPVLCNLAPLFDEQGRVIGGVNCFLDISEIKRVQNRLQEREAWERGLLDALPVAVYTTDAEGRITFFNEAAERFWGRRPVLNNDRWCGALRLYTTDGAPLPHDEGPTARALRENHFVRGAEAIAERPDGSRVPFRAYPTALHDDAGRLVGAVNMLFDQSERKQSEAAQKALLDELNHRVKNTLATVQSLATQSFKDAPAEMRRAFEGRLFALSNTHNQLTRSNWTAADLDTLVRETLAPFLDTRGARLQIMGSAVTLLPRTALILSMMLHELATNAAKFGALSVSGGRLAIGWTATGEDADRRLRLTWEESGGPDVQKPTRKGFGSRLIEYGTRGDLRGTATIDYAPAGVRCVFDIAAPGLT